MADAKPAPEIRLLPVWFSPLGLDDERIDQLLEEVMAEERKALAMGLPIPEESE